MDPADRAAAAAPYLLGLRLAGRRVVVVGGGRIAARRVPRLLDAGAGVVVVAPEVTPAIEGLAAAGRLRWVDRGFRPSDLDEAWYVLAATDDPGVNAEVGARAEQSRIFCVRADDADAATAWTPAVADLPATGDLPAARIAVTTGRPADSVRVRDRLLAAATVPDADDRLAGTPIADRVVRTADRVVRTADRVGRVGRRPPGVQVALVGGGPGASDLLTVRATRMLAAADVVVADRLAPTSALDDLDDDVLVIDAAKLPRGRAMAQRAINDALVEHARAGSFVVRLKGGDPFVFGRGFEELEACTAAGLSVEVVPGVTSAFAGPALAGIPVTQRALAQDVVVVSGHPPPGDPASLVDWEAIGRLSGTVVVLMGLASAAAIGSALLAAGRPADTPVAVVLESSLPSAAALRGTLPELGELAARAPRHAAGLLVIGRVAGL